MNELGEGSWKPGRVPVEHRFAQGYSNSRTRIFCLVHLTWDPEERDKGFI